MPINNLPNFLNQHILNETISFSFGFYFSFSKSGWCRTSTLHSNGKTSQLVMEQHCLYVAYCLRHRIIEWFGKDLRNHLVPTSE